MTTTVITLSSPTSLPQCKISGRLTSSTYLFTVNTERWVRADMFSDPPPLLEIVTWSGLTTGVVTPRQSIVLVMAAIEKSVGRPKWGLNVGSFQSIVIPRIVTDLCFWCFWWANDIVRWLNRFYSRCNWRPIANNSLHSLVVSVRLVFDSANVTVSFYDNGNYCSYGKTSASFLCFENFLCCESPFSQNFLRTEHWAY